MRANPNIYRVSKFAAQCAKSVDYGVDGYITALLMVLSPDCIRSSRKQVFR
jgi:hypothetical protein